MGPIRLLLVEDDLCIAEPLVRALKREGYHVGHARTGRGAVQAASTTDVDLVVLDLGLPDMDGTEVLRFLRGRGTAAPVLVLTARDHEIDLVVGLDAGADGYLTKPFRLAELLARLRALMRRLPSGRAEGEDLAVRVDPESRRVWLFDEELQLTEKEFDVLRVLSDNPGTVISRDRLAGEVWGSHRGGTSRALAMHLSGLRRKLGDDDRESPFITTVRGVGYRFDPDAVAAPVAAATAGAPR